MDAYTKGALNIVKKGNKKKCNDTCADLSHADAYTKGALIIAYDCPNHAPLLYIYDILLLIWHTHTLPMIVPTMPHCYTYMISSSSYDTHTPCLWLSQPCPIAVHICKCIYIWYMYIIHIYAQLLYIYVCVYIYDICISVYVYIYDICMYVCVCVCARACVCIYMYIYMCMYVYIYI
jgi:hypothetical protein